MNKPELGVKRDCPECGARFYDLTKEPAHCPKCDHEFIPEILLKPRKPRREDEPTAEKKETEKTSEVSLEDAAKEQKAPTSTRKPGLDGEESEEEDDDEKNDDENIEAGLKDLGIEIDDDDDDETENDDTLLDADDNAEEDVKGIVSGGKDDNL